MSLLNKKKYEDEIACLKAQKRSACCELTACEEALAACEAGGAGGPIARPEVYRHEYQSQSALWSGDAPFRLLTLNSAGARNLVHAQVFFENLADIGTPKTLSAAGGGRIIVPTLAGSPWTSGTSTIRAGVVTTTTDGFGRVLFGGGFSVYGDVVGGVLSGSGQVFPIDVTVGSIVVNHGDHVPLGIELLVRGGTDACIIPVLTTATTHVSQLYSPMAGASPAILMLQFDDGTFGLVYHGFPAYYDNNSIVAAAPGDEVGAVFELSNDMLVTAAAIFASLPGNFGGLTSTMSIYSNPYGATPTLVAQYTHPPGVNAISAGVKHTVAFPTPVSLSKNTPYALVVSSAGSASMQVADIGLLPEVTRLLPFSSLKAATRVGASGPFTDAAANLLPGISLLGASITA